MNLPPAYFVVFVDDEPPLTMSDVSWADVGDYVAGSLLRKPGAKVYVQVCDRSKPPVASSEPMEVL